MTVDPKPQTGPYLSGLPRGGEERRGAWAVQASARLTTFSQVPLAQDLLALIRAEKALIIEGNSPLEPREIWFDPRDRVENFERARARDRPHFVARLVIEREMFPELNESVDANIQLRIERDIEISSGIQVKLGLP